MKHVLAGAKTHFSLGESIYHPDQLIADAKESGYDAVAVADTMSINALPQLSKAADKHGIQLIFGVTLNVVDDVNWRKPKRGEKKTKNPFIRPVLYIKNEQGLRDVMALLTLANSEERFYQVAKLSLDDLLACIRLGNVIPSTGSAHSVFSHVDGISIAKQMNDACLRSQLIVELCPIKAPYYDQVTAQGWDFIYGNDVIPIISRPVLYAHGNGDIRNTMDCILNRNKVDSRWRNEPPISLFIFKPETLVNLAKDQYDRLGVTGVHFTAEPLAYMCEYKWHDMPVSLPKSAGDSFELLKKACIRGFNNRLKSYVFGYKPDRNALEQYKHRLAYELGILRQMGFEDYFLLVQHVTSWCRDSDLLVGPGRGSVGGSLVAFLLGITNVDPIRFNLIFERFINPERLDLPDIDLDFMSSRREEVIHMLEAYYGIDRVAGISNYGELGAASALRQVASAHNLHESEYRFSKQLGQFNTLEEGIEEVADAVKFAKKHEKIWQEACDLQGVFRNFGRHAAGVVVAGEPLSHRAVIETRHEHRVIHYDKRTCESAGLVKLDILGLSNLDLLHHASRYIYDMHKKKMDWTTLELNDQYVLDAFAKGDTTGVFQFESSSARKLLKDMAIGEPLTFQCLADASALNRPGPLESGATEEYIDIRQGCMSPSYAHPVMESVLEGTHAVLIYQEQVMEIARSLCGFTGAQADSLRKAMGKKSPEEMEKQHKAFVEGAVNTSGMGEKDAEYLFEQIEKFAGYGFNKSHSVAYTLISFITMYIKVHIPHVFYAAALTALGDDKTQQLIRDASNHGIKVLPPDINKSSDRYEIGEENEVFVLYAPLQAIKGLSEKSCRAILEAKQTQGGDFSDVDEFISVVNRRACNIRVRETMDKIGVFASIQSAEPPASDDSRLKEQKLLLPNIMLSSVKATRGIDIHANRSEFRALVNSCMSCKKCPLHDKQHVMPRVGKRPKLMIVKDAPTFGETQRKRLAEDGVKKALLEAMEEVDMTFSDVYFTTLIKVAKPEGGFDMESVLNCTPYIKEEIRLLNPPVVLTLGGRSSRFLMPDIKGKWDEIIGLEHYDYDNDITYLAGFNPGMIHFHPSRQQTLNELFEQVAYMLQGTPS